jgi:hypothetical protein
MGTDFMIYLNFSEPRGKKYGRQINIRDLIDNEVYYSDIEEKENYYDKIDYTDYDTLSDLD